MLRQTAHPTESRYEIVGLFTASFAAASFVLVAVGTLMPYFQAAFGREAPIGLVVTALIFGDMMTTAVMGACTDRFGDRAVLIAAGIVMGIALMASAAFVSFGWLLACLLVYGVGYAALTPAGSHAILFFFKPRERGLAMGIRQTGAPLGGFLGALLFSYAAVRGGYREALFLAGVVVLVVTIGCALLYQEPSALHGLPVKTRLLFKEMLAVGRQRRLILVTAASMLLFCVQIALMGFFPLTLVRQAHLAPALAASLFALSQVAAIAGRIAWGWLSDRYFHGNRALPLAILCLLSAIASIGAAEAAHEAIPVIVAVALLLGFAAEGWFGLSVISMAEVGGEQNSGSAVGFGLTWVFAAGVVAPIIFARLAHAFGYPAAWLFVTLAALLGIFPALAAAAFSKRAAATNV